MINTKTFETKKQAIDRVVPLNLIPTSSLVSLLVNMPLAQKQIGVMRPIKTGIQEGSTSPSARILGDSLSSYFSTIT